MEEQNAILKYFRTFSEEQIEAIIPVDNELSFDEKNNMNRSGEDALQVRRDSLSYVILPLGAEVPSNSAGHTNGREAGNGSENSEEQNKMRDEHFYQVNFCSSEGCCVSPDKRALGDSLQAKCQHVSADCTDSFGDYEPQVDLKQGKEIKKVQRQDCVISSPDLVVGSENYASSTESKTKRVVITVTRTKPAGEHVEPTAMPPPEHTGGSSCLQSHDEEEGKGANEGSGGKERDVIPCPSTEPNHPDASPNDVITPAAVVNNPPPGSITRATFSPGPPSDRQIQLPALFSGLRVLRKGVVGPEHDTVATIRPLSAGERREVCPEKQEGTKVQGSFLDQISQFLNREKRGDEKQEEKEKEAEAGGDLDGSRVRSDSEESDKVPRKEFETSEEAEGVLEPVKPPVSSAEAAFDAFKAFFTPKPLRKDPAEKVDLEAVRRKIRADKDALTPLSERTSNKTPEENSDCLVCKSPSGNTCSPNVLYAIVFVFRVH